MDEPTKDAPEVLETPEAEEPAEVAPEPEKPEETSDEKIARLEQEKADLDKKNKQLFERAKKAETAKPADGLTPLDALTLAKAEVHEDDIDTITSWAKFKGVSVSEAIKDKDLKVVLDNHAEERRTANATNTGGARGASKVSGEDLLAKAQRTGELPDTDEGMTALVQARIARQTKKKH